MMREPREDLGLEVVLFFHRDRTGDARVTFRARDVFGNPVAETPAAMHRVAVLLEDCASALRVQADHEASR
jgi:hypothetical protein